MKALTVACLVLNNGRFSAPRFQICVNNRLSTTNMTLAIDERLEVDSVETFLILRSPDPVRCSVWP